MRELSLFEAVVEPSVERIPLVEVRYNQMDEGRDCLVSHLIYRNVFTVFDQKLSRHIAAVTGSGFPAISTTIRMRDARGDGEWSTGRSLHFVSVPHALRGIANRALADRDSVKITLMAAETNASLEDIDTREREITRDDVKALTAALDFCRTFGEFEFLDISGDFDMVVVQPSGVDIRPVVMDLYRGSISIPSPRGESAEIYEGPLFDHHHHRLENPTARAYVAAARHALAAAKEESVLVFRAAAEERIHNFDRALKGRALDDYRLDAVISLVSRLKAGLGDNLNGLSEDAQITALEWSSSIQRDRRQGSGPGAEGSNEPPRFPSIGRTRWTGRAAS